MPVPNSILSPDQGRALARWQLKRLHGETEESDDAVMARARLSARKGLVARLVVRTLRVAVRARSAVASLTLPVRHGPSGRPAFADGQPASTP